jgi:hypothetical protein
MSSIQNMKASGSVLPERKLENVTAVTKSPPKRLESAPDNYLPSTEMELGARQHQVGVVHVMNPQESKTFEMIKKSVVTRYNGAFSIDDFDKLDKDDQKSLVNKLASFYSNAEGLLDKNKSVTERRDLFQYAVRAVQGQGKEYRLGHGSGAYKYVDNLLGIRTLTYLFDKDQLKKVPLRHVDNSGLKETSFHFKSESRVQLTENLSYLDLASKMVHQKLFDSSLIIPENYSDKLSDEDLILALAKYLKYINEVQNKDNVYVPNGFDFLTVYDKSVLSGELSPGVEVDIPSLNEIEALYSSDVLRSGHYGRSIFDSGDSSSIFVSSSAGKLAINGEIESFREEYHKPYVSTGNARQFLRSVRLADLLRIGNQMNLETLMQSEGTELLNVSANILSKLGMSNSSKNRFLLQNSYSVLKKGMTPTHLNINNDCFDFAVAATGFPLSELKEEPPLSSFDVERQAEAGEIPAGTMVGTRGASMNARVRNHRGQLQYLGLNKRTRTREWLNYNPPKAKPNDHWGVIFYKNGRAMVAQFGSEKKVVTLEGFLKNSKILGSMVALKGRQNNSAPKMDPAFIIPKNVKQSDNSNQVVAGNAKKYLGQGVRRNRGTLSSNSGLTVSHAKQNLKYMLKTLKYKNRVGITLSKQHGAEIQSVATLNGDKPIGGASVLKVPAILALSYIRGGNLSQNDIKRIYKIFHHSSNSDWTSVRQDVGRYYRKTLSSSSKLNKLSDKKLGEVYIQKLMNKLYGAGTMSRRGRDINTEGLNEMMSSITTGKFPPGGMGDRFRQSMREINDAMGYVATGNTRLDAGFPSSVELSGKTGTWSGRNNHSLTYELGGARYFLSVFSDSHPPVSHAFFKYVGFLASHDPQALHNLLKSI